MSENKYYTVNQIAEMFGMHQKTIRRYIQDGSLKACKVGGQWRVTEEDLKQFIDADQAFYTERTEQWQSEVLDFVEGVEPVRGGITQVLSIVDHYTDSLEEVKVISNAMLEVIDALPKQNIPAKFRYQYEQNEKKVRFILQGSPEYVVQMLVALQRREG